MQLFLSSSVKFNDHSSIPVTQLCRPLALLQLRAMEEIHGKPQMLLRSELLPADVEARRHYPHYCAWYAFMYGTISTRSHIYKGFAFMLGQSRKYAAALARQLIDCDTLLPNSGKRLFFCLCLKLQQITRTKYYNCMRVQHSVKDISTDLNISRYAELYNSVLKFQSYVKRTYSVFIQGYRNGRNFVRKSALYDMWTDWAEDDFRPGNVCQAAFFREYLYAKTCTNALNSVQTEGSFLKLVPNAEEL